MKDFDDWNELKKKIHREECLTNRFPKEGEVWMSSFGKNIGYEQNGSGTNFSRPILIIKKFNNHMYWVAPLSTKQKSLDFYFNFTDPADQKVSVVLAQMKLVSVQRIMRKLYQCNNQHFSEVKQKLKSFL